MTSLNLWNMSDKDIEIVFDFSINDGIGKQVVYKRSATEHFGAAWDGHCLQRLWSRNLQILRSAQHF
jgi:hypothetical protein